MSCESMTVQLSSRGELAMVTGIFTCYTHIYMKVLNYGYICWVAMDTEGYISGDVYMESILVYCFHCVLIYILWDGLQ